VCGDLTDHEVVDAIAAWDRMVSWATARQAELVSELAHRRCLVGVHEGKRTPRRDEVDEFAADELTVHLVLLTAVSADRSASSEPAEPAELAGYGPLPPSLTRVLATAGHHRSVVTVTVGASPPTGGEDRYRPSDTLDR
jgi:hypothetical protein